MKHEPGHTEDNHYSIRGITTAPDPINCYICHTDKELESNEREMFADSLENIENQIRLYKAGVLTTSDLIGIIQNFLPITGDN